MLDTISFPLKGKTIVLTRALSQNAEAHNLFKLKGASVLDLPALSIGPPEDWRPLDNALKNFKSFDWIIFSSVNGVDSVQMRLKILGSSLSILSNQVKVAAVGNKTADYLSRLDSLPDFVPPNYVADSLIDHFPDFQPDLKVLIPRVEEGGRPLLASQFKSKGAQVLEVAAYSSSCPPGMPETTAQALLAKKVDAMLFTSSKTVIHTSNLLAKRFGHNWLNTILKVKLISIGPQTTLSCFKYFNRVDYEASPHNLDGLVRACIDGLAE